MGMHAIGFGWVSPGASSLARAAFAMRGFRQFRELPTEPDVGRIVLVPPVPYRAQAHVRHLVGQRFGMQVAAPREG